MKLIRVTASLPADLVEAIDRSESNRSRYLADLVRRDFARRRRAGFLESLRHPFKGSRALAEAGLKDWAANLPPDRASDLVDLNAGTPVKWVRGKGWIKLKK
ncbi:MAG: hypothetical protein FD180_1873 [Planctomycetota bacterium]|nr:MAG: hypothetical protein FD180_1873 [Planctomycetota bacterium]